MGQNMNFRAEYFRDILFVEAEIVTASTLLNLHVTETNKKLYPIKKIKRRAVYCEIEKKPNSHYHSVDNDLRGIEHLI